MHNARVLLICPSRHRLNIHKCLPANLWVRWSATLRDEDCAEAEVVVVVGSPDQCEVNRGSARLIYVAGSAAEMIAAYRSLRADAYLMLGHDDERLGVTVEEMVGTGEFVGRVEEQRLSSLPSIIGHGIRSLLTRSLPSHEDAVEMLQADRVVFPGRVGELARELGCSPDYLTREGARAGVRMGLATRACRLMRLLHVRERVAGPWGRIYVRVGLPSASAGCLFVRRLTGYTPHEAASFPLNLWKGWFFDEILRSRAARDGICKGTPETAKDYLERMS